MHNSSQNFVHSLAGFPHMANVFNPWAREDERDQADANAARIRKQQPVAYIEARRKSTKVILIAEALSCRGAIHGRRNDIGADTAGERLRAKCES